MIPPGLLPALAPVVFALMAVACRLARNSLEESASELLMEHQLRPGRLDTLLLELVDVAGWALMVAAGVALGMLWSTAR